MTRNSNFADRLKEIMDERGYSYGKLGELLDMNPQTLNRYVLGTRIPKIDIAVEIAKALAVEPLWLQGFDVAKNGAQTSQYSGDRSEAILINNFRALNPDGKTKAIAYSHALLGLFPAATEPIPEVAPFKTKETAPDLEEIFEPFEPEKKLFSSVQAGNPISPEEIEAICREFSATYGIELIEFKLTANIMIVSAKPTAFLDEDNFISVSCGYTASISTRLFQATEVETAAFFFQTDMVDREGNESVKNVLKIVLSHADFRMHDGLEQQVASNYNLIFQMADEFYIHPAIKSKLKYFKV